MPLISALPASVDGWMDPDLVPRPVVSIGATGIVMAELQQQELERQEMDFHRHRKGQLLLLLRGVLTGEVERGLWIVPPQSAIWIPGGVLHRVTSAGTLECYVVFIDPAVAAGLPHGCCTVLATPLLRELVVRSASLPLLYPEGGTASRLVALLLDELAAAPTGNLHLPMPADARLRTIVEAIVDDPAERGTMQTWARRVGLSERTLARLLVRQTGMSFGRWR
ncbi:MAG TPA: helix-turn-helix transcriptional regulator, partial [Dokdonella sp.]